MLAGLGCIGSGLFQLSVSYYLKRKALYKEQVAQEVKVSSKAVLQADTESIRSYLYTLRAAHLTAD
jgi:hypothetical protein